MVFQFLGLYPLLGQDQEGLVHDQMANGPPPLKPEREFNMARVDMSTNECLRVNS